ncbi:hypothetical protein ASD97_14230 [Streptomyces sp. Root63]|nr:hypothetical protein ASD29_19400 [Streptomyces sp. Root1295]KRA40902.1 hypothetical protein ASD97_14230 [Streptomyces sp. Root63]
MRDGFGTPRRTWLLLPFHADGRVIDTAIGTLCWSPGEQYPQRLRHRLQQHHQVLARDVLLHQPYGPKRLPQHLRDQPSAKAVEYSPLHR